MDFGMPMAMREALAKKYSIMQQQADADTMRARAQAQLQNQTAKTVVPLANSSIAVDAQNNKLTGVEIEQRPLNYASDRRNKDLQSDAIAAGLPFIAPQAKANIDATKAGAIQSLSSANQSDATALGLTRGSLPPIGGGMLSSTQSATKSILGNISADGGTSPRAGSGMDFGGTSVVNAAPITQLVTPIAPTGGMRRSGSSTLLETPSLIQPFKAGPVTSSALPGNYSTEDVLKQKWRDSQGYKRGTARVPGKGSGDIKPAMLEPGEAVLNKHAAGMMGRDKIAKLNAKGNEKRAQQEGQKLSKLAQALKAAGML